MTNPKPVLIGLALVMIVGGPILAVKGLRELQATSAAQAWPTAPGVVDSSRIDVRETRNVRRSSETYDVAVTYHFQVGGETFSGDRVTFAGVNRSSSSYAEETLAKYPKGAAVLVHYNPVSPSESVLETETSFWTYFSLAIGIVLLLGGLPMLWWAIRLKQTADGTFAVATTQR